MNIFIQTLLYTNIVVSVPALKGLSATWKTWVASTGRTNLRHTVNVRSLFQTNCVEAIDFRNMDRNALEWADVYFTAGLPFEDDIVKFIRKKDLPIAVFDVSKNCIKILDSPYIWVSGYNVLELSRVSKSRLLGIQKELTSIDRLFPRITAISRSTVVVAHTAIAYLCFDETVKPIVVDLKKWDVKNTMCKDLICEGRNKNVNRLFALEEQDRAAVQLVARQFNCSPVYLNLNDVSKAREVFRREISAGNYERDVKNAMDKDSKSIRTRRIK